MLWFVSFKSTTVLSTAGTGMRSSIRQRWLVRRDTVFLLRSTRPKEAKRLEAVNSHPLIVGLCSQFKMSMTINKYLGQARKPGDLV